MILYLHIPPWGSLPVYTEAPRWPEPRRLPLPPRQLALQMAERERLRKFMDPGASSDSVLDDARALRDLLIEQGKW